jgi:hypothetical protein
MRKKIPEPELTLEGRVEEHHGFWLRVQLRRRQEVEEDLRVLEHRIQEKLSPTELILLHEIRGLTWKRAAGIITKMGLDMRVFGNALPAPTVDANTRQCDTSRQRLKQFSETNGPPESVLRAQGVATPKRNA